MVAKSKAELKTISLGWGVQSWTLAAMVALGELEPVDFAVHSDTTWERAVTYQFAKEWTPWLEDHGVKVITVDDPKVAGAVVVNHRGLFIPAFTVDERFNTIYSRGQLRRQCTGRWRLCHSN